MDYSWDSCCFFLPEGRPVAVEWQVRILREEEDGRSPASEN